MNLIVKKNLFFIIHPKAMPILFQEVFFKLCEDSGLTFNLQVITENWRKKGDE